MVPSGSVARVQHADSPPSLRMTNARRLMHLAGVAYLASWCVPVAQTSGDLFGGTVWGWKAFLFAFSPALGNDMNSGLLLPTWMVVSALSNVLVVGAVVCDLRPSEPRLTRLGWALGAAFVTNTIWAVLPDSLPELRVGYFLWVAAFGLGAIAAFWRARSVWTGHATPAE